MADLEEATYGYSQSEVVQARVKTQNVYGYSEFSDASQT